MCQEDRHKATWPDVVQNPTFHHDALEPGEGFRIKWHDDADLPHSSQVYCISAFGTLRKLRGRDRIIREFLGPAFPWIAASEHLEWKINLEFQSEELLNERGATPTSIDAFFVSDGGVISLEGKIRSDAEKGFGICSKAKDRDCQGYYGPGSNAKADSRAWCVLEEWDGRRSPRLYWSYGRAFFRPEVFQQQTPEDRCPFAGFGYQLMRNFLFAAAYAQRH